MLTQADVQHLFHYDPDTGALTWRNPHVHCKCRRPGDPAGAPNGRKKPYLRVSVRNKRYMVHSVVWLYVHGRFPLRGIDHINGAHADNRLCNLREASHSENMANRRALFRSNRSGRKGASWSQAHGKWVAKIGHDGKFLHLGYFGTLEQAAQAYSTAAARLHGNFRRSEGDHP